MLSTDNHAKRLSCHKIAYNCLILNRQQHRQKLAYSSVNTRKSTYVGLDILCSCQGQSLTGLTTEASLLRAGWPQEMTDRPDQIILLVDDDQMGRSVRKLVLEANGHRVLAVGEAELALRTLQEQPIRLAILDYFLDGMTGAALAREMRQLKPQVPILLLSGSADVPDGIEYVDAYLSKLEPVTVIEAKITELLRRQEGSRISPQPTADGRDRAPKMGVVKRG